MKKNTKNFISDEYRSPASSLFNLTDDPGYFVTHNQTTNIRTFQTCWILLNPDYIKKLFSFKSTYYAVPGGNVRAVLIESCNAY